MNFGVTCVSVAPTSPGSEDCQLLVGYQSGYLESWKIFRFSAEKIMAKLSWRGVYPNSNWIQKIAPLNLAPKETPKTKSTKTEEDSGEDTKTTSTASDAPDPSIYLMVTLLSPKTPTKTSGMLEVINIGSLSNDWKHNKEDTSLFDIPAHPGKIRGCW